MKNGIGDVQTPVFRLLRHSVITIQAGMKSLELSGSLRYSSSGSFPFLSPKTSVGIWRKNS